MPENQRYDILIIGSGESGKYLAWTMASPGRRTAVVERGLIGGSCPNIACLPSKNIIHSAGVAELVRMKDRTTRVLEGDQVFLNVGTRAAIPNVPGLKEAKPLTHVEALELDRVPEHLIILGGGYVGLELAQAMRQFGSRVTILERGPQLASHEDEDVAEELLRLFRADGIEVLLQTELLYVDGSSGQHIRIQVRDSHGARTLEGTDILVAAGRVPNTQGLGLDKTGVELDSRGYIRVNEKLQTTAPGIWAMGDRASSPHFTHVAFDDFRVVRDNRSRTGAAQ